MNDFISNMLKFLSIESLMEKGWLELAQIIMPLFLLFLTFFGLSFYIQHKRWKAVASVICALVAFVYLPYEFYRQSMVSARAHTNVGEIQQNLQEFMDSANLTHVKGIADKGAAASVLDEMIHGIKSDKKKELILISWLVAESEKNALAQIDGKQKTLTDDLKSDLAAAKVEIIDSHPPVEKISETIVRKLDDDVKVLVEKKMQAFKEELDGSLDGFKDSINTFVQGELNNYQTKLAGITQQNVDELRNVSNRVSQSLAEQVKKVNQESLKKLDDTKESIEGLGAASDSSLRGITQQMKQLSASLETAQKIAQKRNDILFEYNECMRTTGMLDLGGKGEQCKSKYQQDLAGLK
ncbi:hypothetical protein [Nitrosomonas sp.]|uniref:hypothetical protein n=1 Tax=Nitrosomonas sp. TaxID=42353 RepID=UPI001DEC904C|nr:hypothetical protein [Nitrosomonas sp.]MBX3616602.1 hypothetical protein [Nitrosomonas sp.]